MYRIWLSVLLAICWKVELLDPRVTCFRHDHSVFHSDCAISYKRKHFDWVILKISLCFKTVPWSLDSPISVLRFECYVTGMIAVSYCINTWRVLILRVPAHTAA
jgi:hypothetical protein